MVEDYVPDRLEFELASKAKGISKASPAEVTVDGRYLYGAPAARLELEGEVIVAPASERPGFAGYQFGLDRRGGRDRPPAARGPAGDRCQRQSDVSPSTLDKQPATTRPLEAQVIVRMAEPGGRAVERKLTLPVDSGRADDRRQAAVLRPLARRGRERDLRRGRRGCPTARTLARSGLRYELLKVDTKYQWYRRDGAWDFEPVKTTRRVADGQHRRRRRQAGAHLGSGAVGPLSAGSVDHRPQRAGDLDRLRCRLVCGGERRDAGPARNRARQAGIRAGREHDGRGDRAHRRQGHAQRDRRPADLHRHAGRDAGTARLRVPVGSDWGSGAYVVATLRRPLDAQGRAHARPRHRRAVVLDQSQGTHARARHEPAGAVAARTARCASRSRSAGSAPARRRASSSPRSMSASST